MFFVSYTISTDIAIIINTICLSGSTNSVEKSTDLPLRMEREGDLPFHSDLAIKSDTGQHSQFLQCFFTFSYFECGRGCNTFYPIKFYDLPSLVKLVKIAIYKFIMETPTSNLAHVKICSSFLIFSSW